MSSLLERHVLKAFAIVTENDPVDLSEERKEEIAGEIKEISDQYFNGLRGE
jgi:hypothetical protein